MNIVIDRGNTRLKCVVFSETEIIASTHIADIEEIKKLIESLPITDAIYCDVAKQENHTVALLQSKGIHTFILDHRTPLPISIDYRTPHSLGMDRVAAAVGAWRRAPGAPALIIDAGTAITIDVIDASGTFRGGNITAGTELRLKALHHFTGALPLVHREGDTPPYGYDTSTAIRSGVIIGIQREIEGYIAHFKQKNANGSIFLTGGDIKFFDIQKIISTFVVPNLVPEGLNEILNHQHRLQHR